MSIIEYILKYNLNEKFIQLITDLELQDASIKFEFETDILMEISNLEEKINILNRAEKLFFGIDLLIEELYSLAKAGHQNIWISSFGTDEYGGRLYRTKSKGVGLFIIEKGERFKTPPYWDGTMEMLLKYNGK